MVGGRGGVGKGGVVGGVGGRCGEGASDDLFYLTGVEVDTGAETCHCCYERMRIGWRVFNC